MHYITLTADWSQILEEFLNTFLIFTPIKSPSFADSDQTKHYRYHQNYSHKIEEFLTFKDKIEELVQLTILKDESKESKEKIVEIEEK